MQKNKFILSGFVVGLTLVGFLFSACGNEDDPIITPKPKAFRKINFPEKKYKRFESVCPYTFETPVYSVVSPDMDKGTEPCWLNISYPQFNAQVHISYKNIHDNLKNYTIQSYELAQKHMVKSSGINEQPIARDSAKVYGSIYDIDGNAASSVQFHLTDSTSRFLRGSLYFNCEPNIDSLKIVIDFLREDIIHLIETFKWNDNKVPDSFDQIKKK